MVVYPYILMHRSGDPDQKQFQNLPDNVTVETLTDLLYSSMQSIESLNEHVTELTQKIAELTKGLADTKADVKMTREDVIDLKNRDLAKMTQRMDELTISFKNSSTEVEQMKDEVEDLKKQREVHVVSGEEGVGEKTCAKVCAGSTGRTTTNWINFSAHGVYADVDISECGFVQTPTITSALEGIFHWLSTGPATTYLATATSFRVYIRDTDWTRQNGKASSAGWKIAWTAAGFTC